MLTIDLSNRVAIVTGSSRGIGLAIAKRLLAASATVIINGRTETEALKAAKRDLESAHPGRVHTITGDVGEPEQARHIVRATFDITKRLDILVNNAGNPQRRPDRHDP